MVSQQWAIPPTIHIRIVIDSPPLFSLLIGCDKKPAIAFKQNFALCEKKSQEGSEGNFVCEKLSFFVVPLFFFCLFV
jgi:hypothetical protein